MSNSNRYKSEFLGMPHGTANNRLRKMIIFHLAKQLGLDVCYHCKNKIDNLEEFSIEHKRKWLHVNVELFWDMENIAFSHLKCNIEDADRTRAHRLGGEGNRKIGPPETAWCIGHQDFLPTKSFYRQQTNWNGLDKYCIDCRRARR